MSNAESQELLETVTVFEAVGDDDDDEDTTETPVGRVEIYADGRLELVEAEPAKAAFLQTVVDRVNGKPALALISDEPVAEDNTVAAISVARDDTAFVEALRTYLLSYYGLRLA